MSDSAEHARYHC